MIRTKEATGKTVEEARNNACAQLGVSAEDLNVSCEVLEMPQKTGFLGLKMTLARVRVSVEEPDAPAPVEKEVPAPAEPEKAQTLPAEPAAEEAKEPEQPVSEPVPEDPEEQSRPEAEIETPDETAEEPAPAAAAEEVEIPLVIEENPKVLAAVEYLKEIIALMGVQNVTFSAIQKGEATIIRLDGEKMGALIGRRGETMESLSYLASLVANRLEGDYIKLGLDVAGYRGKRESDLTALAQRIGAKVRKTGRSFAMEPMNPYERRIIHSAIGQMEGVRSESKGEGRDRRVVIYSTDPNAQNESSFERRSRGPRRGPRSGEQRNGRSEQRGGRRPSGNSRGGERRGRGDRGPRTSSVPERSYVTRDADNAAPVAPKRTERVDDFADLSFGKIEL